jgi:formylglycine-generating enzyme required for sulfatase activity
MRLATSALALALVLCGCDPIASGGSRRDGPSTEAPAQVSWTSHRGSDRYGQFADLAVGSIMVRMRYIPPGSFTMGSPANDSPWRSEEEVQHPVTIGAGFWLAESEVTQELWSAVMGSNPSQFTGAQRPVDSVTWDDAQRFINTVHARIAGLDLRLPSEAEWEYACRAGTSGPFALDDQAKPAPAASDLGWYLANAGGESHAVKSKQPNAWGLYDMHGNVQEWCQDVFSHYTARASAEAVRGNGERVSRGGSWRLSDASARSAARRSVPGDHGDNDQGLRLAVTAPPPSPGR